MGKVEKLTKLNEKLKAATELTFSLWGEVLGCCDLDPNTRHHLNHLARALAWESACLALVKQVLPDSFMSMLTSTNGSGEANVNIVGTFSGGERDGVPLHVRYEAGTGLDDAPTLSLAILIAAVSARIEQEGE